MLTGVIEIPTWASLMVVVGVLALTVEASGT
jgi:hypothetical protein